MTLENHALERLDALLDTEHAALLSSDFKSLPAVLSEKLEVTELINIVGDKNSNLQGLKEKIYRNQLLLDEAMAGMRASAQLLTQLRKARRSVDTYDHLGNRKTLRPDTQVSFVKKA